MFPTNAATRVGLNVLLVFGVIWVLYLGQTLFLPLVISLLLAAVLGPAALWMHQNWRLNWTLACTTTVFGLIALFVLLTLVFALSLPRLVQMLPNLNDPNEVLNLYNSKFRPQLEKIWPYGLDEELFPKAPTSVAEIAFFQNMLEVSRNTGPRLLLNLGLFGLNIVWQWILILFILFFLLLEGGMLMRRLVEIFGPSEEVQNKAREVLHDMARQVKTYLVWRTIINVWLAIVVGAVFLFMGLSQPWTWAILLAILNYIPYLGPLVAGIPPFLDALISVGAIDAFVILIVYTAIIVFEGYFIVPVVMGRSMDLNATTVMLACLFWDLIWGTLGLFLAMPLMAAIRATAFHVPGWRPWANLMSANEGQPPEPVILKKEEPVAPAPPPAEPPPPQSPGLNGQGR
jgi:AI-2 transport protein TqsA